MVVNVDIHWNPVRLIQRFGRIDRIGSLNETIRMINFWPTEELNKYLRLKGRVEARMKLVDLSATGHDDLLDKQAEAEGDLRWRDEQLLRLKDEVFDLEETGGGVTLADFALDDFRADLLGFAKANEQTLRDAPLGLHAIVPNEIEGGAIAPGVVFCLRRRPPEPNPEQAKINPLDPFYLVYVKGRRAPFSWRSASRKPILEAWRALSLGRTEPFEVLCNAFDDETDQGEKMEHYNALIAAAVNSIGETSAKRALAALAVERSARVPGRGGAGARRFGIRFGHLADRPTGGARRLTQIAEIDRAVKAFADQPLEGAGRGLFEALGYRSGKTIELDGNPTSFAEALDHEGKLERAARPLRRLARGALPVPADER